jgi:predicted ATPase with chaperone activity
MESTDQGVLDVKPPMRCSSRRAGVLCVVRTLADFDGAENVWPVHLAKALLYRALTDEIRRAA